MAAVIMACRQLPFPIVSLGELLRGSDAQAIILRDMWLPRQAMALLCGGALGLCGLVMQRALRNPLAEPMTLGVASGASLALTLTSLLAPGWLLYGREWPALGGSLLALAAVFALSSRQWLSPLALILAGLMVNLYGGAVTLLFTIINDRSLLSVMIWGGGSLAQQDWRAFYWLLPRLLLCLLPLLLLLRPLQLLSLREDVGKGLGSSPGLVRGLTLLCALMMSSLVISAVGVFGFIGLAAPHLAAACGARTLYRQFCWSPVMGAGLLWLADLAVGNMTAFNGMLLPTGMMVALTGGPLLLLFLPRAGQGRHVATVTLSAAVTPAGTWRPLAIAGALLLPGVALSLSFGHALHGWHFSDWQEFTALWRWRVPRMAAAMSAGVLLAGAGVLIQRLSGNPLASPEILGIGAGASLGITLFLLLSGTASVPLLILSSALGAFATLLVTLVQNRSSAFGPERVLLTGLAVSAFFQSVATVVMVNDSRASNMLMQLMSGSTYYVSPLMSVIAAASAVILLALAPLCYRWLVLLPLRETAPSLGVNVPAARMSVLGLAALMTGIATLIVGPLSFVGLLGPHIARRLGARGPVAQLLTAATAAGLVMTAADWMGRNLLYPRQLPAGLMATLLGGPWLAWLLFRRGRS
ncbi:Fe(3+)-hydroxamate ABC transporter permease FhuB [Acerihabitans sp. KWT182]|uniref:Fe(3+)-hydroxamate ABC transporter permease FhuB n=1 Tax=Acerihabitans sp. KWT182 TaxID=3157919 RepID=A0AAU7QAK3_9GAMM